MSNVDGLMTTIEQPHPHDVLNGRGNGVQYHKGNVFFRQMVQKYKIDYATSHRDKKAKFSYLIYDEIKSLDPPGRFLKYDQTSRSWNEVDKKRAYGKIKQALREGASEISQILLQKPGFEETFQPPQSNTHARIIPPELTEKYCVKPMAKPVKKRMVSDEDSHPLPFGLSKKFQPDNCASSTTIKLLHESKKALLGYKSKAVVIPTEPMNAMAVIPKESRSAMKSFQSDKSTWERVVSANKESKRGLNRKKKFVESYFSTPNEEIIISSVKDRLPSGETDRTSFESPLTMKSSQSSSYNTVSHDNNLSLGLELLGDVLLKQSEEQEERLHQTNNSKSTIDRMINLNASISIKKKKLHQESQSEQTNQQNCSIRNPNKKRRWF